MPIDVKVYNEDTPEEELPQVSEEDIPKILTPDYVKWVNEGIAHRIQQREASLTRTLKKTIFR